MEITVAVRSIVEKIIVLFVLGFPLECVENTDVRTYLMQTIVQTLLSKKTAVGKVIKKECNIKNKNKSDNMENDFLKVN